MGKMNRRLRVDHKTGETFEIGFLAPKMMKKVMSETHEIQNAMKKAWGREPKDREVALLYKDETQAKFGRLREKMKFVEMEKERPSFFSANLMQKSNTKSSKDSGGDVTSTVKPTELA